MTDDITIRPFRRTDLPRLQEIVVEAFDGVSVDQAVEQRFGVIAGHDWKARKARAIADDVERETAAVFVAVTGGDTVGFITTWHDTSLSIGYIPNIAIAAEHRGQGIGRRLIESAQQYFRSLGLRMAKIETLVQNEIGNHLYRSMGFEEVSRQIHFFKSLEDE